MTERKPRNETSAKDIAAFTKDTSKPTNKNKVNLSDHERNDELLPKPLVKILNYSTGDVIQASLAQLNQQARDFQKVILLIEDQTHALPPG